MAEVLKTWVLPIILALLSAAGFWSYLNKRFDKKTAMSKMILGLGHDRIMTLGMMYIQRGYISHEEYEDLYKYLFQPYKEMGGNGSAERIMKEVDKLPIRN